MAHTTRDSLILDTLDTIPAPAFPPMKGDAPMKQSRHRNSGLRKRCGCPRKVWPKCPHSWYFNFKPRGGPHYQLSLDREVGKHVDSKSEAQGIADGIRTAIRAGTFRVAPAPASVPTAPALTFRAFAKIWQER